MNRRCLLSILLLPLLIALQSCGHVTVLEEVNTQNDQTTTGQVVFSITPEPPAPISPLKEERKRRAATLEEAPLPPRPEPLAAEEEVSLVESEPRDAYDSGIQQIISVAYGEGAGYGSDEALELLIGSPFGGGPYMASTDVVSLGNGGVITLGFPNYFPIDGDGPDFIIFENSFRILGTTEIFAEPAEVSVSQDGITFVRFPCSTTPPYAGCAGTNPAMANPDLNTIDPRNPATAGGNAFDLSDLGLSYVQLIRIRDLGLNRGGETAIDAGQAGFDLDAISVIHGAYH
ncbi:MAG: cell surface protein [Deltaproteobacteria bacterium]|nr:cell surface protein [Deltaproteobacteria bacterium]